MSVQTYEEDNRPFSPKEILCMQVAVLADQLKDSAEAGETEAIYETFLEIKALADVTREVGRTLAD